MQTDLSQVKVGQTATVVCTDECETSCSMCSLGFLPESEVKVIRKAPFGGAIYVAVNGQCYGLRKNEAKTVTVKV